MTGRAPPAVRDDLSDLHPYGAPQLDAPVRLNTNENPYPPSPRLRRAVADAAAATAAGLNRYPDRDAVELRKDLAGYLGHGLTGSHVWPANGSNEVIQQLFQAFGGPGRRALGFEPSYSMHPRLARVTCTGWVAAYREPDFSLDQDAAVRAITQARPRLVVLTSPNNPTGTVTPLPVVEAVCEAAPGLVVVDEAYAEFARDGTPSAVSLLPYHLSAVTQAVARAALAFAAEPLATVAALRAERDALVGWLRRRGLAAADSDANFVLFGEFGDRHRVWQRLLGCGVLVREVGPPRWLRVTVGTPQEMAAFRRALDEVLGS